MSDAVEIFTKIVIGLMGGVALSAVVGAVTFLRALTRVETRLASVEKDVDDMEERLDERINRVEDRI